MASRWRLALAGLVLTAVQTWASPPDNPGLMSVPAAVPSAPLPEDHAAPVLDGGHGPAGDLPEAPYTPGFLGDFGGNGILSTVTLDANGNTTINRHYTNATRGAFKPDAFDSPVPVDRVYVGYNYTRNIGVGGQPGINLSTETIGWEYACFDNNRASIGVRLPINQSMGGPQSIVGDPTSGTFGTYAGGAGVGDVTAIFKLALYKNCQTGNIFTVGLAFNFPTGNDTHNIDYVAGESPLFTKITHDLLVEPFAAWLVNFDRFFIQGFTTVLAATEKDEATFLTNDVGVGYRLFQTCDHQMITAVVPLLELHVNTPLDHRQGASVAPPFNNVVDSTTGVLSGQVVSATDQAILTGGVCIGLWNQAFLTIGAAVPLSGTKPYDYLIVSELSLCY